MTQAFVFCLLRLRFYLSRTDGDLIAPRNVRVFYAKLYAITCGVAAASGGEYFFVLTMIFTDWTKLQVNLNSRLTK
jgi:hypothetical protein